jgi:isocitrate/isopropylmalate dehydrogenase
MLRHLGKTTAAVRLEHAVAAVLVEGKHRPPDLRPQGEPAKTSEMADAIIDKIQSLP